MMGVRGLRQYDSRLNITGTIPGDVIVTVVLLFHGLVLPASISGDCQAPSLKPCA